MDREINPVALIQKAWKISAINATRFFDSQMYQPRQQKKRFEKNSSNKDKIKDEAHKFKETGKEIDFNA